MRLVGSRLELRGLKLVHKSHRQMTWKRKGSFKREEVTVWSYHFEGPVGDARSYGYEGRWFGWTVGDTVDVRVTVTAVNDRNVRFSHPVELEKPLAQIDMFGVGFL